MTFAEKVKHLRDKKGWSQDQLAKKIGKSRSAVAGYESETKNRIPRGEDLIKLAEALDTTTGFLLGEEIKYDVNNTPDLNKILRETQPTWNGKPLTSEQADVVIDFLETILKRSKERKKEQNNQES